MVAHHHFVHHCDHHQSSVGSAAGGSRLDTTCTPATVCVDAYFARHHDENRFEQDLVQFTHRYPVLTLYQVIQGTIRTKYSLTLTVLIV